MSRRIWLASYPKSGNTWFRMLVANLSAQDAPVDINNLPERAGIASSRAPFDYLTLINSGLLTHDEVDCLRPRVYEALARDAEDDEYDKPEDILPVRFVKVHDAYTLTPDGEPLLAGRRGADGAIVIVRDPRDIAPSLANHNRTDVEHAIALMNDMRGGQSRGPEPLHEQFRQLLPSWSGHVASWLDQTDLPVHLIRYEDMLADTVGTFRRALEFAGLAASDEKISRAATFATFGELRRQEEERGFRETPRRPGGLFFRRGEAGAWRDELTADQVARIEAAHAPMMLQLGYELFGDADGASGIRALGSPAPLRRTGRGEGAPCPNPNTIPVLKSKELRSATCDDVASREQESTMMVRRQGDWLSGKVGEEMVMMSAEKGSYIGLSEVGVRVWELIETPQEVDAVCALLLDEFEVAPETCRAEVEAFLNELVTHGAVALDPAAGA